MKKNIKQMVLAWVVIATAGIVLVGVNAAAGNWGLAVFCAVCTAVVSACLYLLWLLEPR